jgi:hypothetical protein
MAIVYRIVQDHEGELTVDSRPGTPTRITVRLPLEPARAEEVSTAAEPETGARAVETPRAGSGTGDSA